MTRLERLIHLLLYRHWPIYEFRPISDYLEWRFCAVCSEEREREATEREMGL